MYMYMYIHICHGWSTKLFKELSPGVWMERKRTKWGKNIKYRMCLACVASGGADGEQLLCEIFILFFLYFLLGCLIYVFMSVGSLGRSSKSASARERFSRGVPVRPGATTSARPIKVNLTTYR